MTLVERAAELCSAMAADRVAYPWHTWGDIAEALNTPLRARILARRVYYVTPFNRFHESWAEAASMLLNDEVKP